MTEARADRDQEINVITEAMRRLAKRMNATFVLDPGKVQDFAVPRQATSPKGRFPTDDTPRHQRA
jgi:hypothetical protein